MVVAQERGVEFKYEMDRPRENKDQRPIAIQALNDVATAFGFKNSQHYLKEIEHYQHLLLERL